MTSSFVLLTPALVIFLETSAGEVLKSHWVLEPSATVDSSQTSLTIRTRSALGCAGSCGRNSSCALYSWDPATVVCYLDPALRFDAPWLSGAKVYRKIDQPKGIEETTTIQTTHVDSTETTPSVSTQTTQVPTTSSTQLTSTPTTPVTTQSTAQATAAGTTSASSTESTTTPTAATTTPGPTCPPLTVGNGSVTWSATSQLAGNITCIQDFMLNTNDATVRCLPNLTWYVGGECRQRIFRNVTLNVFYPVPKTVALGWSTCVSGTPFLTGTDSRVSLKLAEADPTSSLSNLLLMDFRISYSGSTNQLVYLSKVNGTLGSAITVAFMPFIVVGQNFTIKLAIKSSTNLDVYLNGNFKITITYARKLLDTMYVSAAQTVVVDKIDAWC